MEPLLGPLSIIERAPGIFTVIGELDTSTAERLEDLVDVHGPLVLDLHEVTFLNSSGIAALVRLHERCPHEGCTFRIEACSPAVERVLRIVQLFELFTADGTRQPTNGHQPSTELQPLAPAKEPGAAADPRPAGISE